MLLLMSLPIR